jgi:L-threonylcarbamoyladenylate synthase
VHKLKRRDGGKPLVVLIADIKQLVSLGLSVAHAESVKEHWPCSLSIIFESKKIPEWLQLGTNTLAVRLPDYKPLRDLIEKTGPLVSTSANLQSEEPAKNIAEAKKYFNEKLDFYVDAGELSGQSSTLVKVENGKLKVLRQGTYRII